jgi:hypothetical protein
VETVSSARTSPDGTVGPLKACGTVAFGQRMVLGAQQPLTGGPEWREWSLTSGPTPI